MPKRIEIDSASWEEFLISLQGFVRAIERTLLSLREILQELKERHP